MEFHKKLSEFLSHQNLAGNINELDYTNIELVIETAKSFERSGTGVYIIDFLKGGFLYVSENTARMCGVDVATIMGSGYKFFENLMSQKDQESFVDMCCSALNLFNSFPVGERNGYSLLCDLPITMTGWHTHFVHHQITPLMLTDEGKIWLALCVISPAKKCNLNAIIKKQGERGGYQYSSCDRKWNKYSEVVLTEKEREIMYLSAQGYTESEISKISCKSVNTIKGYKRKIFQKLGVNNITEAVSYIQNRILL